MADKPLLQALRGHPQSVPPVWLMRQAGRYLPEYREIREQVDGFLDLCFTPDLAAEVTKQPVDRYGLDGAILFSDILVIPYALGMDVEFKSGYGPVLTPLKTVNDIQKLDANKITETLAPVSETVRKVSKDVGKRTTVIGFAGAPWTVATYMLEGGSSRDYAVSKKWAYEAPEAFQDLMDKVVDATIRYVGAQITAGAEAIQLFDSWAGVLPESAFRRCVIEPTRRIVESVQMIYPDVPIIGFPRGSGVLHEAFVEETGVAAVSVDTTVPTSWAARSLQPRATVQGNLDPMLLVAGGEAMRTEIESLVTGLRNGPYVFNLGHGVVPQTPPEHVAEMVKCVRDLGNTA